LPGQYYTQNAAGANHAAGFFYVLKTVVLALGGQMDGQMDGQKALKIELFRYTYCLKYC